MIFSKTSIACAMALLISASLHAEEKTIVETMSQKAIELQEKGLANLAKLEAAFQALRAEFKAHRAQLAAEFKANYLPQLQNLMKSGDVLLEANSKETVPAATLQETVAVVADAATASLPSNKSCIDKKPLFIASSVIIAGSFCWLGYKFLTTSQQETKQETAKNV